MVNEKRLIDANALKEQIAKEIHTYWTNGTGGYYIAEDVIPDIDNAPTVDAVEVVRCKNCKCSEDGYICNGTGFMIPPHPTYPEWFCSCGERRTDG